MRQLLVLLISCVWCILSVFASDVDYHRFTQSSDLRCHGYIESSRSYIPNERPRPMGCDPRGSESNTAYGEAYVSSSCCSKEGRYAMSRGELGGFSKVEYQVFPDEPGEEHIRCKAYMDAFQVVLCDPNQGSHIHNIGHDGADRQIPALYICEHSCAEAFRACGPPGKFLSSRRYNYTDGISLCKALWGGGALVDDNLSGILPNELLEAPSQCDAFSSSYPCQTRLQLRINSFDCLSILKPKEQHIGYFSHYYKYPSPCEKNELWPPPNSNGAGEDMNGDDAVEYEVPTTLELIFAYMFLLLILVCCVSCSCVICACCFKICEDCYHRARSG